MKKKNKMETLNELILEIATKIFKSSKLNNPIKIEYDKNEELIGNFAEVFKHVGIYGFTIEKDNKKAFAYIGKTEGGARLHQHLTGKNLKDGKELSEKVRTKYKKIKKALLDHFIVKVCLYSNLLFEKPSLSCLESALIILAQKEFYEVFEDIKHWNERKS